MKLIKQNLLPIFIVFLLTLPTVKAFATPDFYTSHDGETHTARLANYYLAIEEGQIPPRLAPTLFGGFGFPIFIFIYPLPYLVGSLFHWIGFSYTDSSELVMASGQILSALFIYLFFKLETKKTLTSIIASLFFTWAPYRFLMLYVRGAFAESFAYVFIATSLICFHQLIETKQTKWIGLTAISLSGLLLSHQLVSVMFLPVIVWYILSKLIFSKHKKFIIQSSVLSIILGFAIAAFIYTPAFFERKYLRFDDLISYYQDHFVTIKQLIRSPWSYGFSHQGTIHDDMSFQIGLTHLSAVAFSILSLVSILKHKTLKPLFKPVNFNILWWLIAFSLSALVMLEHPLIHWAWDNIPGLNIVDFPWRFLGVAVASASFITAYLLTKTKNNLLLVLFFVFFIFYANRNHLRINQTVSFSDEYFENYPATATWRNEFLPKARITNKWEKIDGDYQVLRGEAQIQEIINKTNDLVLEVNVKEKSEILIHRMDFPGWQIYIDDQLTSTEADNVSITDTSIDTFSGRDLSGFIKIDLEPGTYKLATKFTETPIRKTGFFISLLGLLASIFIIYDQKYLPRFFKVKK